jgi:hypothetical protein
LQEFRQNARNQILKDLQNVREQHERIKGELANKELTKNEDLTILFEEAKVETVKTRKGTGAPRKPRTPKKKDPLDQTGTEEQRGRPLKRPYTPRKKRTDNHEDPAVPKTLA